MENRSGPHAHYDVRDALADVAASRAAVADRLLTPWWYHPALGAILTALVLVGALDMNNAVRIPVALVCAMAIGLLAGAYQRMTGLWVDFRHLGPVSRRWWIAYVVLTAAVVGTSLLPTFTALTLPTWTAILLAAAILLGTIVIGRRMDAAMRAEIRSGAATATEARR